jgi:Tfp pilus assembly protein PilX
MKHTPRGIRSGEEGMALVLAMFMVLIVSLLGATTMVTSRTETLSSMNYRTMAQARYGAESGVHRAMNYLIFTYARPGTPADPLANYDVTRSPVGFNGNDVVLSSNSTAPNYPVAAVQTAFATTVQGSLPVANGDVTYTAHARLLSMRQITDAFSGVPVTLQTWEVTGVGTVDGAGAANVEVSAVLEQPAVPMFRYAAFATATGCGALSFAGGATTDSYDSRTALTGPTPTFSSSGGHVGTNGNLSEVGNPTTIHGSLSTPRSGVGSCTTNNVTALTVSGNASVDEGLIELPQGIPYGNPATPSPAPPTTATSFSKNSGCPAGVLSCAPSAQGATITPATPSSVITMGNVSLTAQAELHLRAGVYVVNSISMAGNSRIIVDSGPVIFKVVGSGSATPIDLTGGAISNPSFKPSDLQFVYGGSGHIKMAGGAASAALVYAPNADTALSGNSDFYGSIITGVLSATGGVAIHYDRALEQMALTPGNAVMSEFTWKAF